MFHKLFLFLSFLLIMFLNILFIAFSSFGDLKMNVGDIILSDGTVLNVEEFKNFDDNKSPVAVIAGERSDGEIFGVGIYRSETTLSWEEIDNDDSVNASKNYPAFDFVNQYSKKYNLIGDYSSEWYIPSIEELCIIYKNRNIINKSLKKIFNLNGHISMDTLGTNWYWSSSQSESRDNYAWFVHFFNGYTSDCPKNFTNLHVIAIRKF